jgi:hypothetical protein
MIRTPIRANQDEDLPGSQTALETPWHPASTNA